MTEPTPADELSTAVDSSADDHDQLSRALDSSTDDHDQLANALASSTAADDPDDGLPQTLEQARKLRSENKNLRARLHTAETDIGALTARLTASDRREVERIAGEHLVDPADLWAAQPDSAAFYDDEFKDIVADKVVATAKEIIERKPHLAKPRNAPPPSNRPLEGLRGGAAPEVTPKTPTWAAAIRGLGG